MANSYCETQLKRLCERIIKQGITVDNAAMLLAAALKYEASVRNQRMLMWASLLACVAGAEKKRREGHLNKSAAKKLRYEYSVERTCSPIWDPVRGYVLYKHHIHSLTIGRSFASCSCQFFARGLLKVFLGIHSQKLSILRSSVAVLFLKKNSGKV